MPDGMLNPTLSFFLSSILELTKWNSIKLCHVGKWSKFENACPKFDVSPPPIIGAPKLPIFDVSRRLRHLAAKLTANISETKHDMDNWQMALKTRIGLYHCPKNFTNKRLKIRPSFYQFSVNAAFRCQPLQTEVTEHESTKTLPNGGGKSCQHLL